MQGGAIDIERAAPAGLAPGLLAQVEAIFFAAASRAFQPGPEREAFRERWLGRYLANHAGGGSDALILALDGRDTIAGYLVGAVENPALQARFADIDYFRSDFAELCGHFPAHLHINLAPAYRSQGIGALLIEAFATHAASRGAPGMHAVTGRGMRNVGFYARCGLIERGSALWNGREIVFLGRDLSLMR